jgi:sodium-dependent dicarboxylate transporter 2/3/5
MGFSTKNFGVILGILVFVLISYFAPLGHTQENSMLAIALLMAIFWMLEAIPLAATSLLPLILFPLYGISDSANVSNLYINKTIFLFLGGFLIAQAIEKNGLHKRIALNIINLFGGSVQSILVGFIVSCWLLSMFITNTATTIMMLPIGLSVISALEDKFGSKQTRNFAIALMLAIAYSSTLGGISTLVGTVPNLVFKGIYEDTFPNNQTIDFANWMAYGFPLSLIMIVILIFLFKFLFKNPSNLSIKKDFIHSELKLLGKISKNELQVLAIVLTTSLLWIFRKDIDLGFINIYGWSNLLPEFVKIDDSSVAIFMSLILFILPNEKGKIGLINNEQIKNLPWDILLLFGGGFALAKGFQTTGLSELIGSYFTGFDGVNPYFLSFLVSVVIIFLTELTSNTATVTTFLPILASISIQLDINPLILMLPATLAASFAFMLPVATPPNAIVFSSNKLEIKDMMRAGLWLNLIASVIIPLSFYIIGRFVYSV